MDVVRGAVVDDLDFGVGDEGIGALADAPDAELPGRRPRQIAVRVGHGHDLDAAEASQHFEVDEADITRPDEPDLDRLHGCLRFEDSINQGAVRVKGRPPARIRIWSGQKKNASPRGR